MANFTVSSLSIAEVLLVQPRKRADNRGYFVETFSRRDFEQFGVGHEFVQDNQSFSSRPGTVRGLHFQLPPHAQSKLVRVLKGKIFDLAVDLRRGSPTFGKWCSTTLTAESGDQVFVPRGFAHGFCTLAPDVEVAYKVDDYYAPECDAGIRWNDPAIGIEWPIAATDAIMSQKDLGLPLLGEFTSPFVYMEPQ